ncbi:uncharacterized protein LOC143246386 isoform X2 [Tachypleus tridentatus]|uniref:uncharacterized protein LOC143246386 isoform X2 n=1 Tax=Tachypleus tridentatus TaxID=6853 RepID=UPI003FCFC578
MKMKRLNIFPLLFICIVSLLLFSIPCIAADLCRSADSCRCVLNNGSFIDLKPLGNKNNTPRFSGKPSQKNDNATFYFYNPCYSFPCNADNKSFPHTNVAACRMKGTYQQVIGLQNPKFWKTTTGAIALNYSVSTPSHSQNLLVFLECNKSATAPVLRVKECDPCQDNTSMNFTMTLHGKEVCLQISNEDSSSGLSTGSVLLLMTDVSSLPIAAE